MVPSLAQDRHATPTLQDTEPLVVITGVSDEKVLEPMADVRIGEDEDRETGDFTTTLSVGSPAKALPCSTSKAPSTADMLAARRRALATVQDTDTVSRLGSKMRPCSAAAAT